jgi:hypothetical protein
MYCIGSSSGSRYQRANPSNKGFPVAAKRRVEKAWARSLVPQIQVSGANERCAQAFLTRAFAAEKNCWRRHFVCSTVCRHGRIDCGFRRAG